MVLVVWVVVPVAIAFFLLILFHKLYRCRRFRSDSVRTSSDGWDSHIIGPGCRELTSIKTSGSSTPMVESEGLTTDSVLKSETGDIWKKSLHVRDFALEYPDDIQPEDLTPCSAGAIYDAEDRSGARITPFNELDELLDDPDGLRLFWQFLNSSMTSESLHFYRDVRQVLLDWDSGVDRMKLMRLYELYLKDDASRMIMLRESMRRSLIQAILEGRYNTDRFKANLKQCIAETYLALKIELLPRFLASSISGPWRAKRNTRYIP